jgi:hypothetical protein
MRGGVLQGPFLYCPAAAQLFCSAIALDTQPPLSYSLPIALSRFLAVVEFVTFLIESKGF